MSGRRLFWTGIIGTSVSALCCFTSILVILLSALGLSATIAYLDMVLFPALASFILLTVFALWWRRAT